MFNLNEVRLIGRTAKIETMEGSKGKYAIVTVATNEAYKDGDEWKEKATFHRVTVFKKDLVEKAGNKLAMGDLVFVDARLQNSRREKDGETTYYVDIVANKISIMARKAQQEEQGEAA